MVRTRDQRAPRPAAEEMDVGDSIDSGWIAVLHRRGAGTIHRWWRRRGEGGRSPTDPADPIGRNIAARCAMVLAVLLYFWRFARWGTVNHDGMGTQAFDLGIYDQGLWLLSRFKAPFVTIMGRNLIGDHTSFILLPLVPFYWIFPTAKVLLIAQAGALAAGGVPVFLLAREKLRSETLAAGLAVAYLLLPVVGWTNLEQFHPDVFEVPIALFAAWFMVRHKWGGFLACICLLLLVKEDAFLLAAGLGVYVAVKHDRKIGLLTAGISIAFGALVLWVVLPALNGVGTLNGWRIPFGGPWGLIKTTVTDPGELFSYLFVHDRIWYLWQLFVPLALLPLLAPGTLLIALGPLASNLLSTFWYQYDIHYHYSTLIVPVLMLATIVGIAEVATTKAGRNALVALVVGASAVTAYMWGPTPIGIHAHRPANPDSPQALAVDAAKELIPDDAVVSAFYSWVPQVDHRERIYMYPNPFKASYWGVFDREGQRLPEADDVEFVLVPSSLDPEPLAVMNSIRADYEVIFERDGVQLLRQVG